MVRHDHRLTARGTTEVGCFTDGPPFDAGGMTIGASGGELGCYFGFSGERVCVEVAGVRSDELTW